MALKADRNSIGWDISFFSDATLTTAGVVMEKGGFANLKTGGSGVAMDDSSAVVHYAAAPSGKMVAGCLMEDVRNDDLTRVIRNEHKPEVQAGEKVALLTHGTVVTDMIYPGLTITAGQRAFLVGSGLLTNSETNRAATPLVGQFLSSKDEDGYAKVMFGPSPQASID